jgi:hypothetical protein
MKYTSAKIWVSKALATVTRTGEAAAPTATQRRQSSPGRARAESRPRHAIKPRTTVGAMSSGIGISDTRPPSPRRSTVRVHS